MEQISFYLKKFENLGLRENNIKKIASEAIKELTTIDLDKNDIEISRDQIKIKKTGPAKTEIFIHRAEIENLINSRISNDKKTNKKIV